MKILITGANGMLGRDISEVLKNHELLLSDKEDLDITNPEQIETTLQEFTPEIIVNCAGYIDVEKAEDQEDLANKINADGVLNLARACKNSSCVLLHISTEYVFDGENINGYDENAITNPINIYGKSKALGEKLLQENLDKFYLVRSSWLYGKNPQLGKERGMNFVETMLKLAKERDELNLITDQISKPTYTKDLSFAIKQLIEENYPHGVYHLVNESPITPFDFAKEIFSIKHINTKLNPISYTQYPTKSKRPLNAILNNIKFPKLRIYKEALKDYLDS